MTFEGGMRLVKHGIFRVQFMYCFDTPSRIVFAEHTLKVGLH